MANIPAISYLPISFIQQHRNVNHVVVLHNGGVWLVIWIVNKVVQIHAVRRDDYQLASAVHHWPQSVKHILDIVKVRKAVHEIDLIELKRKRTAIP